MRFRTPALKYLICLVLSLIMLSLSGCAVIMGIGTVKVMEGLFNLQEVTHYLNKENFVTDTAQVDFMFNYPDRIEFRLSKGDHDYEYAARGENAEILRENGLFGKISAGDTIEFVCAPAYLGSGYIAPIVAIKTMDGEEILGFDEGYKNLLESYR